MTIPTASCNESWSFIFKTNTMQWSVIFLRDINFHRNSWKCLGGTPRIAVHNIAPSYLSDKFCHPRTNYGISYRYVRQETYAASFSLTPCNCTAQARHEILELSFLPSLLPMVRSLLYIMLNLHIFCLIYS